MNKKKFPPQIYGEGILSTENIYLTIWRRKIGASHDLYKEGSIMDFEWVNSFGRTRRRFEKESSS